MKFFLSHNVPLPYTLARLAWSAAYWATRERALTPYLQKMKFCPTSTPLFRFSGQNVTCIYHFWQSPSIHAQAQTLILLSTQSSVVSCYLIPPQQFALKRSHSTIFRRDWIEWQWIIQIQSTLNCVTAELKPLNFPQFQKKYWLHLFLCILWVVSTVSDETWTRFLPSLL